MKHFVLDMHGVVYTHSESNNINESESLYGTIIDRLTHQFPDVGEQELEYQSITGKFSTNDTLPIYFTPQFITHAPLLFQNEVTVFSNSLIETSQWILDLFSKKYLKLDLTHSMVKNSAQYGSKKVSATWNNLLKEIGVVDAIFEDKYGEFAKEAAKELRMTVEVNTGVGQMKI